MFVTIKFRIFVFLMIIISQKLIIIIVTAVETSNLTFVFLSAVLKPED
jgi:hypothetical protein